MPRGPTRGTLSTYSHSPLSELLEKVKSTSVSSSLSGVPGPGVC